MKIRKWLVYGMVVLLTGIGGAVRCDANEYNSTQAPELLVIVADHSKEVYGTQLKDEVLHQLDKQLKVAVYQDSENQDASDAVAGINWAEQDQLLKLAASAGYDQVLVVEILPVKSNFSDILFYKAVKSEATLRIRWYDAHERRYRLAEDISGTGINKTYLPYTSVGKKPTVLDSISKAAQAAAEKINQSISAGINDNHTFAQKNEI